MRFGLAIPQYDFSIPGEDPLPYSTVERHARRAEELGFDSVWLSDHFSLNTGRYGGPDRDFGAYEPITTLAALATAVPRVRLGTLVLMEALRPPAVLAKSIATLDRISGGRVDLGLGGGWHEADFAAIGMELPSPGDRITRLREALTIVGGLLRGEQVSLDGRFHTTRGAVIDPPPLQEPRPPLFVGGSGDRLLRTVAELADGWNTAWASTDEHYRGRLEVLHRACDALDRDPATIWQSIGLYALCGEDEADLARRFRRLQDLAPGRLLDRFDLAEWRSSRLVGTPEQIREQVAGWADLGVETVILSVGSLPFQITADDDVDLLAEALGISGAR